MLWILLSKFFETKFFLKPSKLIGQRSCGTLESKAHSRESQKWDLTVVRMHKPNMVRRPRYSSPLYWNHHKKANNDDENSLSAHKVPGTVLSALHAVTHLTSKCLPIKGKQNKRGLRTVPKVSFKGHIKIQMLFFHDIVHCLPIIDSRLRQQASKYQCGKANSPRFS